MLGSSAAEYGVLFAVNLCVLLCLIHRYSLFSAEGLALSFMALSIVTDAAGLSWTAMVAPNDLRLGTQEFDLRVFPSAVHLIGLLAFGAGLLIANPRPRSLRRAPTTDLHNKIFVSGLIISVSGFALFVIAILLVGAYQSNAFYSSIDQFRSEELPFGGFWYRGVDIGLFGLCLMFAGSGSRGIVGIKRFFFGMAILVLPLVLLSNKGGLEKSFIYGVFVLNFLDYKIFERLATTRVFVPAVLIVIVATGAKNVMRDANRDDFDIRQVTFTSTSNSGMDSIANRYSSEGLYRGFCTMVAAMHDGQVDFYDGRILRYTLSSWIPRALRPDKADHPFRAIGYMINPDGHVFPREVSAPTFVGFAYGDFGMASTISYLFVGGLFAGFFRRYCTTGASLYRPTVYTFFTVVGGISPEGGFIGVIYIVIMVFICMLPVRFVESFQAVSRARSSSRRGLTIANNERAMQPAGIGE